MCLEPKVLMNYFTNLMQRAKFVQKIYQIEASKCINAVKELGYALIA